MGEAKARQKLDVACQNQGSSNQCSKRTPGIPQTRGPLLPALGASAEKRQDVDFGERLQFLKGSERHVGSAGSRVAIATKLASSMLSKDCRESLWPEERISTAVGVKQDGL